MEQVHDYLIYTSLLLPVYPTHLVLISCEVGQCGRVHDGGEGGGEDLAEEGLEGGVVIGGQTVEVLKVQKDHLSRVTGQERLDLSGQEKGVECLIY